jgi:hypothetical protein
VSEVNTSTSIDSIYQPAIATCNYLNIQKTAMILIKNLDLLNNLKLKAREEILKYPQKTFTEEALIGR